MAARRPKAPYGYDTYEALERERKGLGEKHKSARSQLSAVPEAPAGSYVWKEGAMVDNWTRRATSDDDSGRWQTYEPLAVSQPGRFRKVEIGQMPQDDENPGPTQSIWAIEENIQTKGPGSWEWNQPSDPYADRRTALTSEVSSLSSRISAADAEIKKIRTPEFERYLTVYGQKSKPANIGKRRTRTRAATRIGGRPKVSLGGKKERLG